MPIEGHDEMAGVLPSSVMGATLLDDGRVFVTGLTGERRVSWAGIYDPATGRTTPIRTTRAWRPASTRLADGRVLIVGGLVDGGGPASPTVEIFR